MKKTFSILAILLVCLCTLTLGTAVAQDKKEDVATIPINAANVPSPRGYLLGPGDEIEVRVLGEPQFDGKYTVDEDGRIALAFVENPIQAACRTEREVRADVTAALAKYLKKPQVSLQATAKRSRPPAVVYGEVRVPQRIEMLRAARLQEVLAFSGGVTEKAGGTIEVWHTQPLQCPEPGEEVQPMTTADGQNIRFQIFKLKDISSGKSEANPIVRPGDVIVVQKAPPVYIVGEVRLLPQDGISIMEEGLTLTEAVARAGGLTREAKKKDVRIYRLKQDSKNPGDMKNRETISRNLDLIKKGQQQDEVLQPYDIIEVEKARKSIGQIALDIATGTITNVANVVPQTAILR